MPEKSELVRRLHAAGVRCDLRKARALGKGRKAEAERWSQRAAGIDEAIEIVQEWEAEQWEGTDS